MKKHTSIVCFILAFLFVYLQHNEKTDSFKATTKLRWLQPSRIIDGISVDPTKPMGGVVLLGTHWSGTSLLAGLLADGMGYRVGKGMLLGEHNRNTKGSFELLPALIQNDVFLYSQNVTWDGDMSNYRADSVLNLKDKKEIDFENGDAALAYLNGDVMEYFRENKKLPWLQKDPRMCITLRTWLPLLNSVPAVVHTFRHPLEVARSFQSHNGLTLERGLRLWINYNAQAVKNSADLCRVTTSNEAIIADPVGEVERIVGELTEHCGVMAPPNRRLSKTLAGTFVDPNLQQREEANGADITEVESKNINKVAGGVDCGLYEHQSEQVNEARSLMEQSDQETYLIAMKVYCDLKRGVAYEEGYQWPHVP